jgi:hypothetical protein
MSPAAHLIPAEWLSAYYDGELDPPRQQQVEAHLSGCAECRLALAGLKQLSEALSVDDVRADALTRDAVFWRNLKPQLPDRPRAKEPAASPPDRQRVWLRWLPGLSLLLLSGGVQAVGAAITVALLVLSPSVVAPAWVASLNNLAAGAVIGWSVWLLPAEWTGWGLFAVCTLTSVGLAVLYLAWLGYEWRYGWNAGGQLARG